MISSIILPMNSKSESQAGPDGLPGWGASQRLEESCLGPQAPGTELKINNPKQVAWGHLGKLGEEQAKKTTRMVP